MVRRLADTLADTALPADVLAEMERLNGEAAPLHLGLPPQLPPTGRPEVLAPGNP